MLISMRCAQCGRKYRVKEEHLLESRCVSCGSELLSSSAAAAEVATAGDNIRPDASVADKMSQATVGGERRDEHQQGLPKQIGRFLIRRRIGAGGFGAVFLAYDPVLDREVALKVPHSAVLANAQAKARFLREPKAAAQLRHPHIVPVFDAGSDGEEFYIASAYIEGRTLEELLEQEGPPDFPSSAQIVRDLAEALDYAHGLGIVHRDVKPSNIMIDERGQALLMDFGLAHIEHSQDRLTQDGTMLGTPAYMAPEQADGAFGEVGPAVDQYGLGVVFYELLCGERPFSGPPSVVIFNTLNTDPDPPRKNNAAIPRDLETICLKAISKHQGDRYVSCALLAEDLRRYAAGDPLLARPIGLIERAIRWSRRKPLVSSLMAAILFVLLVGFALVSSQWRRAEKALSDYEALGREMSSVEDQFKKGKKQLEDLDATLGKRKQELADADKLAAGRDQRIRSLDKQVAGLDKQRKDTQKQLVNVRKEKEGIAKERNEIASQIAKQREKLQEHDVKLRRHQYIADMQQASACYEQDKDAALRKILMRYAPAPDKEDLRHFEWYFFYEQCELRLQNPKALSYITWRGPSNNEFLEFSDDGDILVAVGRRNNRLSEITIASFDLKKQRELYSFDVLLEHRIRTSLSFASQAKVLACLCGAPDYEDEKTTLRLWNAVDGTLIRETNVPRAKSIRISPDGKTICVWSRVSKKSRVPSLWDATTLTVRKAFPWPKSNGGRVRFSPESKWLIMAYMDGNTPRRWIRNVETGKTTPLQRFFHYQKDVRFVATDKLLIRWFDRSTKDIYRSSRWYELVNIHKDAAAATMCKGIISAGSYVFFSQQRLAYYSPGKGTRVVDLESGSVRNHEFSVKIQGEKRGSLSPSGKSLITLYRIDSLKMRRQYQLSVWDMESGIERASVRLNGPPQFGDVKFSPTGEHVVCPELPGGSIRIWHAPRDALKPGR